MPGNSESVSVLTNRNSNARTGAYLHETILRPANVNVTTFGKLFSRTVDGDLYAQPLIVSGLKLGQDPAGNVVILCTSRNWVYAYDADQPTHCLPFWQVNLGPPVARNDIFDGYTNFAGEIGIISTPVIDLQKSGQGILYVVAKSRVEGVDAKDKEGFAYKIHALDIRNGKPFDFGEEAGSAVCENPKIITARATDPATGQSAQFDAKWHLNRPGLLLLEGVLYLAFGSQGDKGEFWGWIMAYDALTLEQLAVHCTALAWGEGGIWQSGCGLAGESVVGADGQSRSYVYAVVGNGQKPIPEMDDHVLPRLHTIPAQIDAPFYGNCLIKLTLVPSTSPLLSDRPPSQGDPQTRFRFDIVDWFTASNCFDLNEADDDFIGGPVLFTAQGIDGKPTDIALGGGKDGKFYLCDRNHFGRWQPVVGRDPFALWDNNFKFKEPITLPYQVSTGDVQAHKSWAKSINGKTQNQILQDDQLCNFHIHGAPVLWQKSDRDVTAYVWSEKDCCKAYLYSGGKFDTLQSTSEYRFPARENRMPGGILALSADGTREGTGIVWASHPTDDDGMNKTVKGTLRAFDAGDLNVELWTSDKNPDGEDRLGDFAKFCPPVVANGKVYVATFSRELVVYGLLEKDRTSSKCDFWDLAGIGANVHGSCKSACARYNLSATGEGLAGPGPAAPSGTGDPGESRDSFYFANVVIDTLEEPEISITARVLGIRPSGSGAKTPEGLAGVMIRAFDEGGNLPFVPYASMVFSSVMGTLFLRRLTDKSPPIQDRLKDYFYPNWVRVSCEATEKIGVSRFTGAFSSDAIHWQQVGPVVEIEISGRVMVGLVAAVQGDRTKTATANNVLASFSDVVVAPRID
jgi:hypothetical protein